MLEPPKIAWFLTAVVVGFFIGAVKPKPLPDCAQFYA